ncbi:MAG TPA: hypothetical protein VKB19_00435 [Pedobacter sp.]|nr:hypothetical protein [Pedobacter sp.]
MLFEVIIAVILTTKQIRHAGEGRYEDLYLVMIALSFWGIAWSWKNHRSLRRLHPLKLRNRGADVFSEKVIFSAPRWCRKKILPDSSGKYVIGAAKLEIGYA